MTIATPELPKGWTAATLDELRDPCGPIIYGILQPGPDLSEGIPYVRPSEIQEDKIQISSLRRTSKMIADKYKRATLFANDIVLSIVGTIGKVAIVPPELQGANITQSSARIRANSEIILHSFLAWLLRSPLAREQFDKYRLGTGVPRLNLAHVREIQAPVPPRNEQLRIVDRIEALQRRTRRARAALDAIPPLLERFRQSVLSAAFRGDLTADWRAQNPDVEPASVLLERIREERRRRWEEAELAKMKAKGKVPSDDRWKTSYKEPSVPEASTPYHLPKTWKWARLDSLAFIKGGLAKGKKRKPSDILRSVPYLRVANVQRGFLDLEEVLSIEATSEEIDALNLHAGDILFNEGGDRDKLGRGWIWEGQIPICIHQNHVFRARLATAEIFPELISQYANAHGQSYFMTEGKQTTNLASISLSKLSGLPVPVIPTREAKVLSERLRLKLSSADLVKTIHSDLLPALDLLDQSVLAKAFRGELVPQDPNDEPASKLLERIRAAKQEEPAQRGRRRAKNREPKQEAPTPKPSRPQPTQEAAPKPEPPLPDNTNLRDRVHRILLGRGPLDRDAALREAASALRDDGAVDFQRLRRGGPLYQSLDQALDSALAANLLDEPVPGEVRAVLRDARAYTRDDWRHALLSCLGDEPAEREDAIEAAAIWAAENTGLEYQRLRRDGVIVKGLKSALRAAIRRGEVEKLGPSRVRKSRS